MKKMMESEEEDKENENPLNQQPVVKPQKRRKRLSMVCTIAVGIIL